MRSSVQADTFKTYEWAGFSEMIQMSYDCFQLN